MMRKFCKIRTVIIHGTAAINIFTHQCHFFPSLYKLVRQKKKNAAWIAMQSPEDFPVTEQTVT